VEAGHGKQSRSSITGIYQMVLHKIQRSVQESEEERIRSDAAQVKTGVSTNGGSKNQGGLFEKRTGPALGNNFRLTKQVSNVCAIL